MVGPVMRDLTDAEVRSFLERGWVFTPGLIRAEAATGMRDAAEEMLRGTDYKSVTSYVDDAFRAAHHPERTIPLAHDVVLSPVTGRNCARLLRGNPRVRMLQSTLLAKWGAADDGQHGPTPYHQDFPGHALDRSEMLTIWIALNDITPDMGSLRFCEGSHRFGALGRSFVRAGDDAFSQHPWLKDLPLSPPLTLRPGDATIHHGLTIHGAPRNTTHDPRIVLQALYVDAAALYNGARLNKRWDAAGLKLHETLDNPEFPLLPADLV